jgi:hypothetical protein
MSDLTAIIDTPFERAPNLVVPIDGMNIKDQIARRRRMAQNPADYAVWGKMFRLFFDPAGMRLPDAESLDHPVLKSNELNWENEDPRQAPTLALSRDDKSLLILAPVPALAPVEAAELRWPDDWEETSLPGWQTPRGGTWVDAQGKPIAPGQAIPQNARIKGRIPAGYRPKRYPQRYSDLTLEFTPPADEPNFSNPDCFLVIRPVSQIYLKLSGLAECGLIEPITAANGTQMTFLINPKTREGHLIGGAIRLSTEFHTLPAGAKP